MKLQGVVFDFDGVIVDSEPIHFECLRDVLSTVGVDLGREEYYEKYLGLDDHDALLAAAADQDAPLAEHRISQLIGVKTKLVRRRFRESIRALPGAVELIGALAAEGVALGICSGALREEIELASACVGAAGRFGVVIGAEEVGRGKPDPEGYALAVRRMGEGAGRSVAASGCAAIEDSPAGIAAAKGAGLAVLAVTTSYGPEALTMADRVVGSLAEVGPEDLEALLR